MITTKFRFQNAVWILMALLAASLAVAKGQTGRTEVPLNVEGFGDGWKVDVNHPPLPSITNVSTYQMWIEDRWLHVSRRDSNETVWRIVLAKVQEGVTPKMWRVGTSGSMDISYADGRYFIRDNNLVLRTVRQSVDSKPTFLASEVFPGEPKVVGFCADSGRVLVGKTDGDWFIAASGPSRDDMDCFVRLNRHGLYKPNTVFGGMTQGFSKMADGMLDACYGAKWVCDDGELLVAYYNSPRHAQRQLNQKKIRDNLTDEAPPEITVSTWLNTEPLNWEQMQGRVVLLDFWATWCLPCVKKLPEIQRLADKFGDEGLVVIGIHAARGGDSCEEFAKKIGLTFPLAIDTGKTQETFGFDGFPSYFLVDKSGKVVNGYMASPPDEETIRFYLNAKQKKAK